jgi:hypothetical protein
MKNSLPELGKPRLALNGFFVFDYDLCWFGWRNGWEGGQVTSRLDLQANTRLPPSSTPALFFSLPSWLFHLSSLLFFGVPNNF